MANPDLDERSIHLGISKNQVSLGAVVRHAAPLILAQMLAALTGPVLLFNSEPMASHADPICIFISHARSQLRARCGESRSIEQQFDCVGCCLDGVLVPRKVKTSA